MERRNPTECRRRFFALALLLICAGVANARQAWSQEAPRDESPAIPDSSARESAAGESDDLAPLANDAVTLLVPGMAFAPGVTTPMWGSAPELDRGRPKWTGMIGALQERGHTFGGVIRPRGTSFSLPECLDTSGAEGDPSRAKLFEMRFTASAETDGLAYKAMELAVCARALRAFTGAKRVHVVAHSAGGLVARAYLQSALPGFPFEHEIDRLITIGSPHLGSALAHRVGDVLGTRATSLDHDSELVRRLNQTLELPADTRFAAIIARGIAADVRGGGADYDAHLDPDFLDALPLDFREGGDEVVHVRSQNLALSKAARRYELATGTPVQFYLARVQDPSPADLGPLGARVHVAETRDPEVTAIVASLLTTDESPWTGLSEQALEKRQAKIAQQSAIGLIENATLDEHSASEVQEIEIESLVPQSAPGEYRFAGIGKTRGTVLRRRRHATRVEGTFEVSVDRFGRVTRIASKIERVEDD